MTQPTKTFVTNAAAAQIIDERGLRRPMKPDTEHHRWIFTFGFGHVHPDTGDSLANRYVVIDGDVNESRATMVEHFGLKWANQYPTEEAAGVQKYNLQPIELGVSE